MYITAVLSDDAVPTLLLSEENAIQFTLLEWYFNIWSTSPDSALYIIAVLSLDAVAIFSPSGENITHQTKAVCYNNLYIISPVYEL